MNGLGEHCALEEELGEPPPADLVDALDPDDLDRLADLVVAAKERQVRELAQGGQAALTILPRLIRAPFSRALGL